MASNLHTVITRDEAIVEFKEFVLPATKRIYESDGIPDYPARSEAWNNFVDSLNKENRISDWQAYNWSHPDCNIAPWER